MSLCLLPLIFDRRGYRYYHSIIIMIAIYLLDLILMPKLSEWITLSKHWHLADFVVCLCLYTGLQITRTTIRKTAFYKRNLFLGGTLLISLFWTPTSVLLSDALFFLHIQWHILPTSLLIMGLFLAPVSYTHLTLPTTSRV